MINNATSAMVGMVDTKTTYSATQTEKKEEQQKQVTEEQRAAVYEKAEETKTATYSVNKMSAEDREALVKQLKEEQTVRQQQFIDMVQKMMNQQSSTFSIAMGTEDEDGIWKFLAGGKFTVDAATKAQAQADIAEDGYYGVKQTSERLFDFASALAGDDVEKMKKMQEAVTKGFNEATKAWGKDLPDICQQTLDATNQLFEDYYASKNVTQAE